MVQLKDYTIQKNILSDKFKRVINRIILLF